MNTETERTPEAEATGVQEEQPAEIVTPGGEPIKESRLAMTCKAAGPEVLESIEVAVIRLIICQKALLAFCGGDQSELAIELDSLISDANRLMAKMETIIAEDGAAQEETPQLSRPHPVSPDCDLNCGDCANHHCETGRSVRLGRSAAPRREEDE